MQKKLIDDLGVPKSFLYLTAILLLFVLLLVFIWLWYDLKMARLEQEARTASVTLLNTRPGCRVPSIHHPPVNTFRL